VKRVCVNNDVIDILTISLFMVVHRVLDLMKG
jgi:hypothetical protein